MQKITPCLWFDNNAEAAVKFYASIFKGTKTLHILRNGDIGPGKKGSVLTILFKLRDEKFLALNGGPQFKFNHAVSFMVNCKNQKEIDFYWDKLSKGGTKEPCGWVKDKFGLSWQIVPADMMKLHGNGETKAGQRVMAAMLKMKKLDIATLEKAHAGK